MLCPDFASHIHPKDYNASTHNLLLDFLFKQSRVQVLIQTGRVTTFSAFSFISSVLKGHSKSFFRGKKKLSASGMC